MTVFDNQYREAECMLRFCLECFRQSSDGRRSLRLQGASTYNKKGLAQLRYKPIIDKAMVSADGRKRSCNLVFRTVHNCSYLG